MFKIKQILLAGYRRDTSRIYLIYYIRKVAHPEDLVWTSHSSWKMYISTVKVSVKQKINNLDNFTQIFFKWPVNSEQAISMEMYIRACLRMEMLLHIRAIGLYNRHLEFRYTSLIHSGRMISGNKDKKLMWARSRKQKQSPISLNSSSSFFPFLGEPEYKMQAEPVRQRPSIRICEWICGAL